MLDSRQQDVQLLPLGADGAGAQVGVAGYGAAKQMENLVKGMVNILYGVLELCYVKEL